MAVEKIETQSASLLRVEACRKRPNVGPPQKLVDDDLMLKEFIPSPMGEKLC